MRKLRIAILASNFIRIPPRPKDIPPLCSGAPEYIVSLLTEGLVKKGHDVTLFASGDSKTSAKLISVTKRSTGVDPKIGFKPSGSRPHIFYELILTSKCFQLSRKGKFDVINSHIDMSSVPFASLIKTPVVTTLHSDLVGHRKFILEYFGKTQYFVSISNNQRRHSPSLKYAGTIYNAVDFEKIPLGLKYKNYLVIMGRIHPCKGIKEAIQVAKKVNLPLIIMGSHDERNLYWKQDIKPEIDGKKIIYKGFIPRDEMLKILREAKAFIFPLQWDEPFGITMIESMACGTPVITFNRGSIPEVVKNKKTGFIVNNINEMADAVGKINQIDRNFCRQWVKDNFSIEKMVEGYENIFYRILKIKR
jgi:glycosyltransferase involved in cell wall biosynthesis